jgi:DNA (cytosine-5)-methyltransferase 1
MNRPLALDLFCKAGGASMGLYRAGFDVTGVDIEPQPNYPFRFVQGDALLRPIDLRSFDFIWASPPCQDYSALKRFSNKERGKLIPAVRAMLQDSGIPYVIENVVGSDLINPIRLCGSMFGLGVWRHRLFEMSHRPTLDPQCNHSACPKPIDVTGTGGPFKGIRKKSGGGISRKPNNLAHAREVMGIDWMSRKELSQAIPPAFAEYIGLAAMRVIRPQLSEAAE